ncbi:MAG: DUF401 family protein [Desulfurococcales archaeon]|nr:DUF401 family protein [Desulfurococcales archaeon]
MSTLVAFTLGYIALAAMVARGRGPLAAIAAMISVFTVYIIYSTGLAIVTHSILALTEWSNVSVLVYIFLSLLLAGMLKETGKLDELVSSTTRLGCRFSYLGVPALIGLLPMPGGALVSAIAMRRRYLEEAGMPREWASYLNYWFRHIWIPSWPLFQSIVITAAVLGIEPGLVVTITWPITPLAILAGLIVSYPALTRYKCPAQPRGGGGLLASTWPFILLALLVFTGIASLLEALLATLAVTVLVLRPHRSQVAGALRLALRPRIHGVLIEALILKELLLRSGAPQDLYSLASNLGAPGWAIVFTMPFILGLAAGGENFFAATAMPLLVTYIVGGDGVSSYMLLLAYAGGMLGVMASPVHLCFALTVDYYKARPGRVMALTLVTVFISVVLVFLLARLLSMGSPV